MITFSSTISSILQGVSIESFYCVKIGSYKTTSFNTNITLGADTYQSDGRLLLVDPPRISATVDREIFKVTLADSDFYLANLFQGGIVGSVLDVKLLFIDPATSLPILTTNDVLTIYKGIVDNISIGIQTGNTGEANITISGASPMNDLDLTRTFYSSKEYIRGRYPFDSCFDQIYEGSGPVSLKWGKG